MRRGWLAEWEDAPSLMKALVELRGRGYTRLDAFTPYPVHGLDEVLGWRRSRLPPVALLAGAGGALIAYFIQWYCAAWRYPVLVGGRPAHAPLAFVPITFEMGVLAAGLTTLLALLLLSGLPRLAQPLLDTAGFERASHDRFWLGVDDSDPRFDRDGTRRELQQLGARTVRWIGDAA